MLELTPRVQMLRIGRRQPTSSIRITLNKLPAHESSAGRLHIGLQVSHAAILAAIVYSAGLATNGIMQP